jgi:arginase
VTGSIGRIGIIDAPSDLGLRRTGVMQLPDALRAAGLLEHLRPTAQRGRIAVPPWIPRLQGVNDVANTEGIVDFAHRLAAQVGAVLDHDEFPLILGGDCSILLGSALALRRRGRFGLFHIDGHADFYSPETELNGEAASMDLALVTGHGPEALTDLDGLRPLLRESDAVLFAYRDAQLTDEDGSPDVRESSVRVMDLESVRRMGVQQAARQALESLMAAGVAGVFIHLDADVLHDDVMPAVDYRMPDGLWPHELTAVLAQLLESGAIVGMEVTIYNPTFDDAMRTAGRRLVGCIAEAFEGRTTAGR